MGMLVAIVVAGSIGSVTPTPIEMDDALRWVAAKFEGVVRDSAGGVGIEVVANHGPLQANRRGGQLMHLGTESFSRGLYAHAPSRLIVRLPEPGQRFEAVVGVDTNDQTSGGRGSVVFAVQVGGKTVWTSDVRKEGMPGAPVSVDLGGVTEFVLEVSDAGDGMSCDQADWLDAVVTLANGRTLALGDMPIAGQETVCTDDPFFSFVVAGTPSGEVLRNAKVERVSRPLDDARVEHTITYTDAATGLAVRCAGVAYKDFPIVEWTLYFRNTGVADSPVISDIQAVDTTFEGGTSGDFALHHHNGTYVNRTDYQPFMTPLKPGETMRFTPSQGRPCAAEFPYYNIQWSGGSRGVIAVIGWPGKWAATFVRDDKTGLRIAAGQELTHFRLHPGEEVRTPLIVLQFWRGDHVRSQNIWRRWMIAHNIPRRDGQLPPPQMPAVSGNQFPGLLCNEAGELRYIDRFAEERIPITHWWMDAGWYINKGDWTSTGTWEVDTSRFPRGVRAVADHAHAKGEKLIVWFEPERVTPHSWLAENHPEWVLGGKAGGLLDLGNPEAWKWLVDHYDALLTSEDIDFYRQDFNMDPLPHWRTNDTEDRQGITEIRHCEGYLAFWDELVKRHPDLMIDSCASGGHRNDLETLRRSVPLLRSDFIFDWPGEQCHTYGFASWIPYWGTGIIEFDAYSFRSCLGLDTTLSCDARRTDIDWDLLRKLTAEWREVAPCFWGDYYPLTPYSLDEDAWMAWQFNRADAGEGIVQAFRRAESPFVMAAFPLHDLEPEARYAIHDMDAPDTREMTGRELMESGLPVSVPKRPQAALIHYTKCR